MEIFKISPEVANFNISEIQQKEVQVRQVQRGNVLNKLYK